MDNNVDILATNGADQQFMEQCVICIEQNIDNPNFDVNMFAQAFKHRTYQVIPETKRNNRTDAE